MEGSRPSSTSSARELIERGHEVTTFAAEGSDPLLHPVTLAAADWAERPRHPAQRIRESTYQLRVYRELLRRVGKFDLIHLHTEFPGMAVASLLRLPVPCVATVHCGIDNKVLTFLQEVDRSTNWSRSARPRGTRPRKSGGGASSTTRCGIEDFETRSKKNGYLVELARITPTRASTSRSRWPSASACPWSWPARSTATRPRGATSRS